jgi:hypothetical protein
MSKNIIFVTMERVHNLYYSSNILKFTALENGVRGRMFALKRGKVILGWRKLNNEEFHNLRS